MTEFYAPGGVNQFSRPLDVAFADLAVEETPGHPNRGKMVDKYIEFVGLDPGGKPGGYHWCCAAAVYWAHKGGVLWVPKTGSVYKLWRLCKGAQSAEPRIGDAFVHLRPDQTGHIGLVADFDDENILTVEGNSNRHGSRVGNAVVRGKRNRHGGYITGYLRLDNQRVITVA